LSRQLKVINCRRSYFASSFALSTVKFSIGAAYTVLYNTKKQCGVAHFLLLQEAF
jgi:hypothetical protein